MSRRRDRGRGGEAARGPEPAARGGERAARGGGRASRLGLGAQIGLLLAVFALVALVAEIAGAANLGVALGIGQIGFAIAAVYLLVRA